MDKLKDCPFCGGKAYMTNGTEGCRVVCKKCGANVPRRVWYPSAIRLWNRRFHKEV